MLKDRTDMLNSWGFYIVFCQCGLSYIGEIKQRLISSLKAMFKIWKLINWTLLNITRNIITLFIITLLMSSAIPTPYLDLIFLKHSTSIKIIMMLIILFPKISSFLISNCIKSSTKSLFCLFSYQFFNLLISFHIFFWLVNRLNFVPFYFFILLSL